MLRFEDLKFFDSPEGVKRARAEFGKYSLSVILEPGKNLYEAAILDENLDFIQLPGIHRTPEHDEDFVDDVLPYKDEQEITGIMLKLACISEQKTVY